MWDQHWYNHIPTFSRRCVSEFTTLFIFVANHKAISSTGTRNGSFVWILIRPAVPHIIPLLDPPSKTHSWNPVTISPNYAWLIRKSPCLGRRSLKLVKMAWWSVFQVFLVNPFATRPALLWITIPCLFAFCAYIPFVWIIFRFLGWGTNSHLLSLFNDSTSSFMSSIHGEALSLLTISDNGVHKSSSLFDWGTTLNINF